MKIRPSGAKLFHVDGQTDGRIDREYKAKSRFLQFCEHSQ
jgi:hypothetical protein